ncbi:MAG: RluA family pseudouridine synthase [Thermanaerothrix sp.]|nr:RluA family pseudouridine synthase [Thermanaerothrix sp.]
MDREIDALSSDDYPPLGHAFVEAEDAPKADPVQIRVPLSMEGHRLDFFISQELGLSRSYATRLIRLGRVVVSWANRVKPALKVPLDGTVWVDLPPPEDLELQPEDVPFQVVYEDQDIVVINKPAGLVVHPAPGHWRGTLVHGLLYRYPEMMELNGVRRPGIVHRLDSTTSGLMVVARNGLAMEGLIRSFKGRWVDKVYIAAVSGSPYPAEGEIRLPIGRDPVNRKRMAPVEWGRDAHTIYRTLWSHGGYSLVLCQIKTGRTHQIRVHMKAIGHPLVGDQLYGGSCPRNWLLDRVFLHSWRLSFQHPRTGETMSFVCPLPDELVDFIVQVRRGS